MNCTITTSLRTIVFVVGVAALVSLTGCGPTYPKCDTDNDCRSGEFCVNGLCQQCRNDTDCGKGQQCASGRCEAIKGYCNAASDCGPEEDCVDNRCTPKPAPVSEAPAPEPPSGCSLQSVYFDFDSSDLRADARDALSRNAACVKEQKINKLHITGYTDPRGTEEYNLALGDRRAQSVAKYLGQIESSTSISVSSVGKEMASGKDESSWARDRRAEFRKE
jgi:peptidoglycan-associated lipoprotein